MTRSSRQRSAWSQTKSVVVPYGGKRPAFPASFFLTHAVAHGTLHRTEICMMMRMLGVEPPNLDGWEYAAAMGYGADS